MKIGQLFSESGVLITFTLIVILVGAAAFILYKQATRLLQNIKSQAELDALEKRLASMTSEEHQELKKKAEQMAYKLSDTELSGEQKVKDKRGLVNKVTSADSPTFLSPKKKGLPRPKVDPALSRLILWFIGTATAWLLFGTTVGEYLGIKFVSPDADSVSWLSFGRLRPVHTNAVFWGWSSIAMVGLAYYVVPRVSNTSLHSVKRGYATLILMNLAVFLGTISLMAGINNGGGEYREYIWPVMTLFGAGIFITLVNLYKTVAKRSTHEIYVSNWYIISALMFVLVISFVAYWPTWQSGLGETIIQGYWMHQGVGMWFMLFCLGLMYYFLPQQLNKPIYSYSLGILAFWTQILFYTLIGTHHFIFSAIPWWMQTIAIVGSMGMVIPVIAGTTNFLMTFKGAWGKLAGSYTLPFYFIGIVFYFSGSLQGTAEAFRFTNLIWHFTDFTVAHSHLTMYGIICFMLWAFIYTLIPRLTGKEPPHATVGAHFWLAFIGLLFYTVPLMIGSTLKGLMWLEGAAFIDSVTHMAPYWLWRAIGGSLMWLSHWVFAYNFYCMVRKPRAKEVVIPRTPAEILATKDMLDTSVTSQ